MTTFLPKVRRTLRGFSPDTGRQYELGAPNDALEAYAEERAARGRLAQLLRAEVRPGDRIEVDGGSYHDLDAAAAAAPVDVRFTFVRA